MADLPERARTRSIGDHAGTVVRQPNDPSIVVYRVVDAPVSDDANNRSARSLVIARDPLRPSRRRCVPEYVRRGVEVRFRMSGDMEDTAEQQRTALNGPQWWAEWWPKSAPARSGPLAARLGDDQRPRMG